MQGANLRGAFLDTASNLTNITLSDEQFGTLSLADIHWGDVNLAVVEWSQIKILGDEYIARQKKRDGKRKERKLRLEEYENAARANRQLSVVLQAQGLIEDAAHFAYRAQLVHKDGLWHQMLQPGLKLRQRTQALGSLLFSWFLFLFAGYEYKLGRSFFTYLLIISLFMTIYRWLDPHLLWNEAFVVSMTAFHGRGFSPSTFTLGDPVSLASISEAFVGLIIEVTFIATLTQRFFNR